MTSSFQMDESAERFSSQESVGMPVNHIGADILHPGMLVKNLGHSAIQSLTATPDSGFFSPSSGTISETFSIAPSTESTPRSSRVSTRSEHTGTRSPVAINKTFSREELNIVDFENESPLDKSLHCVQWLQNYSMGDPVTSFTTSTPHQSVIHLTSQPSLALAQQSSCNNQAWIVQPAEPPAITNFLAVSVPTVSPVLNLTPMASGSSHNMSLLFNNQPRRILQEVNTNICHKTEPQKPQYERPSYSYMDLIKMALKHSEDGQMTLREIVSWIEDHFPYFKYVAKQSWKSSIRCNLSMHSDFTKLEGRKRGAKWKVVDGARSFLHRLPKPPVIKNPIGPKVPAVSRLKSRRSDPLPILPKSVPYALVPLSLAQNYQGSQNHLQQQALQILQQHHHQQQQAMQLPLQHQQQVIQLPLQLSQLYQQQQQTLNVNTTHQLLPLSSLPSPQQIKPSLQQIAPKLQQELTSIVWNPQTLILGGHRGNVQSDAPNHAQSNLYRRDVQTNSIGINQSSSDNTHNARTVSRSSTLHDIIQPVDIQVHEGSQVNEKKIVFYLKQKQDPQNPVHKVSSPATTDRHHSSGETQLPQGHVNPPLRTRSICKTVDKIQRSKSFDVENRNVQHRPYFPSKREERGRKVPVMNLENFLKESERSQGSVENRLMRDDKGKSLTLRPCSAPMKCLIQQAWDQADVILDSDCDLLGNDVLCSGETRINHDHLSARLDESACSSLVVPKEIRASVEYENKENQHDTVSNILYQAEGLEHYTDHTNSVLFQPIDIPESCTSTTGPHSGTTSLHLNEFDDKSCRHAINRSGNIKSHISRAEKQAIHKDIRSFGLESGIISAPNWQLQERQDKTSTAEDRASSIMAASKIVYQRLPKSHQRLSSARSTVSVTSVAAVATSPSLQASQYEQPSSPQPRFYRTRSRRKQIHNPLTTDLSPHKVRPLSELNTTASARKNQPELCSDITMAETVSYKMTGEDIHVNLTPPRTTDQTNHATSSPNTNNPTPLDFALFLSNMSRSPCLNLCDDSHTAQSLNWADDEAIPLSSSSPRAVVPASKCPASHSAVINNEVNVQNSSSVTSPGVITLSSASPTSRTITSNPCQMPVGQHSYQNDNFLNISPPLLSSEDIILASCGYTFGHFLSLTSTPPAGNQPISTSCTPTHGIKLPTEILNLPNNSSGFLDSSLFDNLESLMQSPLFEFKTP